MNTSLNKSLNTSFNKSYDRGASFGEPHPNHWSQALYATMQDPNMVEYEDEEICIVKGKYFKLLSVTITLKL